MGGLKEKSSEDLYARLNAIIDTLHALNGGISSLERAKGAVESSWEHIKADVSWGGMSEFMKEAEAIDTTLIKIAWLVDEDRRGSMAYRRKILVREHNRILACLKGRNYSMVARVKKIKE